MKVSTWQNCYDDQWRGLIVPEAHCHPAKFSPGLIKRIFQHCLAQGYLQAGDTVVDPFGGIGGGGLFAPTFGLKWVGIELESRFVDLARKNFAIHAYARHSLGYPHPIIIQGDSRCLSEIVGGADGCVLSPPYAEGGGHKTGQAERDIEHGKGIYTPCDNYGSTPGQIGRLKAGSVDAVCTSPPYAESVHAGNGIDPSRLTGNVAGKHSQAFAGGYGCEKGNIGNLRAGDVGAVVSGIVTSPPWENNCEAHGAGASGMDLRMAYNHPGSHSASEKAILKKIERDEKRNTYGQSPGQLGQTSGDTYWQAVADVYRECHKILRPGGVLVVVLKAYVKQGRRVPLPQQTLKLLIRLGFEPLERIKAMLVKEEVTPGLFGDVVKTKARKSFFRRLAESKGSPRIDWEEVLVCRKCLDIP